MNNIFRYRRDNFETDANIVPYNWMLLLQSNSHIAVELTTIEAIVDYLTKYLVKDAIEYTIGEAKKQENLEEQLAAYVA